jgi:hypothetical protein
VFVRLGYLDQGGVRLHVLDVGLDQRSAFLDGLNDFLLADDALSMSAFCAGVSFRPGMVSCSTFFLPKMAAPAEAGIVAARRRVRIVAPAVDLAREIMIYGSL